MIRRSLSRRGDKSVSSDASNPHVTKEIRSLAERAQSELRDGLYEEALKDSAEISLLLSSCTDKSADDVCLVYLSSLVWQVRALQRSDASSEAASEAVNKYYSEAVRLNNVAHCIHSLRMKAQAHVDAGRYHEAIDNLRLAQDYLTRMPNPDTKLLIELTLHIGALSEHCSRFDDAIEALCMTRDLIEKKPMSPQENHRVNLTINLMLYEMALAVGSGELEIEAFQACCSMNREHMLDDIENEEDIVRFVMYMIQEYMRCGDYSNAKAGIQDFSFRKDKLDQNQCDLINLLFAQVLWAGGEYESSESYLSIAEHENMTSSVRAMIMEQRLGHAIEIGKPGADPDKALADFRAAVNLEEMNHLPFDLSADLLEAGLCMQRGQQARMVELLEHVKEKSTFVHRMPYYTEAQMCYAEHYFAHQDYQQSFNYAFEAIKGFAEQHNMVMVYMASVLAIRASLFANKPLSKALDAMRREMLDEEFNKYAADGCVSRCFDLGIPMAYMHYELGNISRGKEIMEILGQLIKPERMAYHAMQYELLCAKYGFGKEHIENARSIADINGFYITVYERQ